MRQHTQTLRSGLLASALALTAILGTTTSAAEAAVPGVATGTNTPEGQGAVLVRGYVDPNSSLVTGCEFLYGPTSAYGSSAACIKGPGAGTKPVEVTAKLTGLAPGATYHFQLLATNGDGTTPSTDAVFATFAAPSGAPCANAVRRTEQHATGLPGCRAYEMVSPPDKNGGDVIARPSQVRAAVGGDAAEFASLISFADPHGTGVSSEFIAKRNGLAGTQGWATHAIMPKLDPFSPNGVSTGGFSSGYVGEFSPDLSKGTLKTGTNLSGNPNLATIANLYLRENVLSPGAGTYSTVSACPACSEPFTEAQQPNFAALADATPDLGQIVFETRNNLTADASGGGSKVYESDHGALRLVSILPQSEGGAVATAAISGTGAKSEYFSPNVISDDGRRIFFTAIADNPGAAIQSGTIYMRVDGAETVRISGAQLAKFETASADGTRVFFTEGGHLWMYEVDAGVGEHLTDIAPVAGVMGTSADGSFVYFSAGGSQLVPGQPPLPASAPGIYAWHAGTLRYIGYGDGSADLAENLLPSYMANPLKSRVSPDGQHLLFTAHAGVGLTGYPHGAPNCGGLGCTELYRYSYPSESLLCASCNPSGAPASASASFAMEAGSGASEPTSHLGHPLSDDGRFVFFTSFESLLSEDTNGVSDAYSYDAESGQVSLLSSGTSSDGSYFLDASLSGENAFFVTRERLVGWDADGAYDLYDARIDGGFPEPPPTPAACAGDGCQAPSPAAAAQPSAASATFAGPGNIKPQRKHPRKHQKKKKKRTTGNKRGGVK